MPPSSRNRIVFIALAITYCLSGVTAADDWPQWRGPGRDGVWRETGIIDSFDGDVIEPVWRVEIGSGYSGPTVAAGRVYVTDRVTKPKQVERVHCFDEKTGTTLWSHEYDCVYRNASSRRIRP